MRNDTKGVILIVDDTPASISEVETALIDAGYQVSVATSGEKAFDRISAITPDLILLDIMMPGIDGYETCRRLKEEESTRSIPIIFLSVLTDTVDKVKAFDLGATDYIINPIAPEELLSRVQTHMSLKRLEKQLEHQNTLLQDEITVRERAEEALHRANEELESRVRERTADLAATNEELLSEIKGRKQAEELKWRAFTQIEKNIEQFAILNDQIRNPLSIILTLISEGNIPERDIIVQQVMNIDDLIDQLDKGYLESEKVSQFLMKHRSYGFSNSNGTKDP